MPFTVEQETIRPLQQICVQDRAIIRLSVSVGLKLGMMESLHFLAEESPYLLHFKNSSRFQPQDVLTPFWNSLLKLVDM